MGRWGFSRHQMNRVIKLLFRTIARPLKMLCHHVMGILIAYPLAYNWSLWRDTLGVFCMYALRVDLQAVSCCSENCTVHLGTKNKPWRWLMTRTQFYPPNQRAALRLESRLCWTLTAGEATRRKLRVLVIKRLEGKVQTSKSLIFSL